ncbi:MAG: GAF domain-containing protein [Bacteroidota bacterium]|nr:GAF domain-containing protein [Bacteroidota bacterium]
MRRNLRLRIFFSIILTTIIIYVVAISVTLFQVKKTYTKNLTEQTQKIIKSSADFFNKIFSEDLEVLRATKNALEALSEQPYSQLINLQDEIVSEILEETPQFLSLGISWEMKYADSSYYKNHGRYRYVYYWANGTITIRNDTLNVDDPGIGSLYYMFKISKTDDVTDIYKDSYSGKKQDMKLMSSIGTPIMRNNNFIGLLSCDISLDRFNRLIIGVKPNSESHTFLISHTGRIVANSDGYINKPVSYILRNDVVKNNILIKLKEGKTVNYVKKDSLGRKSLVIIEPFYFGKIKRAWGIGVIVPLDVIQKTANNLVITNFIVAIIGLFLIVFITIYIVNRITKPINDAVASLSKISEFDISEDYKLKSDSIDEIGKMVSSINRLIDSLSNVRNFTYEISKGNLDVKYEKISEKDVLSQAFINMQRSLKIASLDSDKRVEEEKTQKWVVDGESIIGEILRDYSQQIDVLYYKIISQLTKYTNSSQGAIFIVNHDEKNITLEASYAYERRRYLKKNIPFGVGLIGRSVQEAEMIYITDVPKGYSSIVSGLGKEEPRSILIVPFKFNDIIYAVVELNSFYDFRPHMRKFVDKIGVSVASTIANLQITLQTTKLVDELKMRAKQQESHDEEMKQNLEEMQTTQEELHRKVTEYEHIVGALNQVSYVVEYNMERKIVDINNKLLQFLDKSKNELIGTTQGAFMENKEKKEELDDLWKNISMGKVTMFTQRVNIGGKIYWFSEAYIPVFNIDGIPHKVINIINDITKLKEDN